MYDSDDDFKSTGIKHSNQVRKSKADKADDNAKEADDKSKRGTSENNVASGKPKIRYFEQFDPDEIEEEKERLREIGNNLQNKVKAFTRKYFKEDVDFKTIEEGSKMVNLCEANFGKYLSYLHRNERMYNIYSNTRKAEELYSKKLSDKVTSWLQRFSPQIVDITSYNRAKGLAETLVRLYQTECQEMFKSARSKLVARHTDKDILECLRECLRFCYERCRDFAWRQCLRVLEQLTLCSKYDINTCLPPIRLRIREMQKLGASYTLPHVQKVIRQAVVSELSLRIIVKNHHTQKPPLRTFLDLCTEVTWFMQFQDPPIVLDFTSGRGKEKFMPYSTRGQEVDFVVWPAMLLHENGMIVSLGVAEFHDTATPNLQINGSN